ncbi:unnamed protein product [Symbiodinium sp. KB8]|nr:unnamed protein product [Symbiodinium sp. KB8]
MRSSNPGDRFRLRAASGPTGPPTTKRERRTPVRDLRRPGDPLQASRAASSLLEFVERQIAKLNAKEARLRGKRRHPHRRLWLDHSHWLAWTMCGELVVVEELEPGSGRGSPEVRRLELEEYPDVFAADRLVTDVIALYQGDSLDDGPVWRYMAHHDHRGALTAALARAQAEEARLQSAAEPAAPATEAAQKPASRTKRPATKTRHDPRGNYILYRRPRPDEGLPDYAAVLQLPPVPAAFPDTRSAKRFIKKMPRLGLDPEGLVIARVMAEVEAQPVFRSGLRLPRDPEELLELIRKEPRIVLPELNAAWVPRYELHDDGQWRKQVFQVRRTVRTGWHDVILRDLGDHVNEAAPISEENQVRRALGEPEFVTDDGAALTLMQKAARRLPTTWLERLEMVPGGLQPPLRVLQAKSYSPPSSEEGHWLRAPYEFRDPDAVRPQRQLVELRIDDIAGLLEFGGLRLRFLLVRGVVGGGVRWMARVREILWQ